MSEMYVKSKTAAQAAGDVRQEQGNRLNNNGMNRDRTDKNAVADEFDFAAMRANLGKKKATPAPASAEKLAQAKAKTGLEPGAAQMSNQMFVGSKKPAEACGDARIPENGRLTNNGMNRDRTDRNAVGDSNDFNSLRAGLRKVA